jgi:hypothetical protein
LKPVVKSYLYLFMQISWESHELHHQFWIPNRNRDTQNMKTSKPFLKAFVCAGVVSATLVVWLIRSGAENLAYRIGYTVSGCLFPALIAGFWARFSKQSWSWARMGLVVFVLIVIMSVLSRSGARANH